MSVRPGPSVPKIQSSPSSPNRTTEALRGAADQDIPAPPAVERVSREVVVAPAAIEAVERLANHRVGEARADDGRDAAVAAAEGRAFHEVVMASEAVFQSPPDDRDGPDLAGLVGEGAAAAQVHVHDDGTPRAAVIDDAVVERLLVSEREASP